MVAFELTVIVLAIVSLLLIRKKDKAVYKKFLLIFIGILLFQYFTQSLWLTVGLEKWAYLYLGVSWIITLGRATMVIVSIALIDIYFSEKTEKTRFWLSLILITLLGIIAEWISVSRGTIEYHPALQEMFSGATFFNVVPIESLFYIPVFMVFVLALAKYWESMLNINKSTKSGAKKR